MVKNGLISILMPVYEAEKFLPDCLDSILRQTEQNWELLAIDDFSTDNSWIILNQYASLDSRIKVIKNDQKGIIPALRLAFQHSQGQFITRMDADDRMMPQKLATLKSLLSQKGLGHVGTGLVMYFSDTQLGAGYKRYEAWLNHLALTQSHYKEIYKECVIPSPCWMVFREDLERCGSFHFNQYPEDYDLCFRFYQHQLRVIASENTLHLWRDHPDRTSRTSKVYADQQYLKLKMQYYFKLDYNKDRPLILWGAGRKGKRIAKMLNDRQITFNWFCNNPSKWGIELYDTIIENYELLPHVPNPQVIIAVSNPEEQEEIKIFLDKFKIKPAEHYFFFC